MTALKLGTRQAALTLLFSYFLVAYLSHSSRCFTGRPSSCWALRLATIPFAHPTATSASRGQYGFATSAAHYKCTLFAAPEKASKEVSDSLLRRIRGVILAYIGNSSQTTKVP